MGISRPIALVVGCALALGACRSTPEPAPPQPVLPLEQADWAIFWTDFDRRLDHAMDQGLVPPYDEGPLATYAAGPELAVGRFNVALNRASGRVEPAQQVQHAGVTVYSRLFTDYPMWLMAGSTAVTSAGVPGTNYAGISVFNKDTSSSPWLVVAHVPLAVRAMPRAVSPAVSGDRARSAEPQPATIARTEDIAAELIGFWQDGVEPSEVTVDAASRSITEKLTSSTGKDVARAFLSVERYPDQATYAVKVRGADLAMLSFRATAHYEAKPGRTLSWSGPRAVLYGSKPQPELLVDYAFMALVSLPADGSQARVLGTGLPEILTRGRPQV